MTRLYVDQLLTQIAKGFRPFGHINEIIMPPLGVKKKSGKIAVYGADNLRLVTSIKSPNGETPVVTMNPTMADAYLLDNHALKVFASDEDAENQDDPFNEQRDKTELVTDLLSVGREIALATFMSATGSITNNTTLSGTAQWGQSAQDPIGDIDTAVKTVADAMGVTDDQITVILPQAVRRVLVRQTMIQDTLGFKYNQTQGATNEQLAAALNIKNVLCPAGIYNSAAQGQTDVIARIWGKNAWAVYIPDRPQLKQQAFGYTMRRSSGAVVDKWYENDRKGWWVRNTDEFDQYVLNVLGAYLIKNAIA